MGTGCNMTACSSRSRAQQQRPHGDSHCSLPLKLLVPLLTSMQAKAGQLQPLLTVLSLVFLVPSSGNPSHQLQAVPRLALLCSGHLKMAVGKACEKQVLKVVWLWKSSLCSLGHSLPVCRVSPGPVNKSWCCISCLMRLCMEAVLKEDLHTSARVVRTIWQWLVCYYSLRPFILTLTDASARDRSSDKFVSSCLGTAPASFTINTCKKLIWGFCSNFVSSVYSFVYLDSRLALENVSQTSCSWWDWKAFSVFLQVVCVSYKFQEG